MSVSAYRVWVQDREDWARTINAETAGRAKAEYWRDVRESWPSIPFTAIRVRRIGPPASSDDFLRVAAYRGMPTARCGDELRVSDGRVGVIVGHNSSANFDVLLAGAVYNVHPHGCELMTGGMR